MLSIKDGESLDPLFKDVAPATVIQPDEGDAGPSAVGNEVDHNLNLADDLGDTPRWLV